MTLLIFILVLGLLVLVHELGHFIAAKRSGCYVEEFGIGFPPRLFSRTKGETRYAINLLPLGGYVKIKGENGNEPEHPRSFSHRTFGQKILIVSAGVLMNVFLGYVLISLVLAMGARTALPQDSEISRFARIEDRTLQVVEPVEGSPAKNAGIQAGDIIRSVNGTAVGTTDEMTSIFASAESGSVSQILIERDGQELAFEITPVELQETGKPGIGVALLETGTVSYPWYLAPFVGLAKVAELLWLIVAGFGQLIGKLVTGQGVQADVAGPVGIAVMTGEVAKQGIVQLLQFTALLSLNLAVINILPIPALDGGRLALIIFEKVRGRKMRVGLENWIHILGFTLLMALIVFITVKDLATYGGSILNAIGSVFN